MKRRSSILFFILFILNYSNAQNKSKKLVLMPDQGKMHCNVIMKKGSEKNIFAITVPETIGCKEGMILNFPSTNIKWDGPDQNGIVSTTWITDSLVKYTLKITPNYDFVDAKMTITNIDKDSITWHDVWSFNCLSPAQAEPYRDSLLERTYMSTNDGPKLLSKTQRTVSARPTIGVYFNDKEDPHQYPFVRDFNATSPDRTNGNYLVTLSKSGKSYMAATSPRALYLFDNLQYKCIHSAPNFGDIESGKSKTVTCRFYFAEGNLNDFLARYNKDNQ